MNNEFESMKVMLQSQLEIITRIENLSEESVQSAKRSKRSEKVSIKVAELVLNKYEDMVKKDKLEDWEADEISELIREKTTEITQILFPSYTPTIKKGTDFFKVWKNVNCGLYSIYKKKVNQHKGSYRHTKRIKFEAAKLYILKLNTNDYRSYRNDGFKYINDFVFVEPVFQERIDVEKMINDEIDREENGIKFIQ